jgi:hypothetical protein
MPVPGQTSHPFCGNGSGDQPWLHIIWTLRAEEAPQQIRESWVATSWIVDMTATNTRDGKPFQTQHLFLTILRTIPKALLHLVRDRWSTEGWHFARDVRLGEDAQRYANRNGVPVFALLRTIVMNLLRLGGFQSIQAGMQAVVHDFTALLAMALR